MRIVFLLLLSIASFGQQVLHDGTNLVYDGSNKVTFQQGYSVDSPARIKHTTIPVGIQGSANIFIREPEGVNNGTYWPVIIGFLGDGTDSNLTTTVPYDAMTGGPTTWTVTANNSGTNRVLSTSVIIYDDGVEIGRGQIGGTITGPNLTSGSVSLTGSNSTISITSSVSLSGDIYAKYTYSVALQEGLPLMMNLGDDFEEKGIVVFLQNRLNDLDHIVEYFDNTVTYLWNNYSINPKRIGTTGLSRGGQNVLRASAPTSIAARYQFWINEQTGAVSTTDLGVGWIESGICASSAATAQFGGTYTLTNLDGIGVFIVHGTADGTLTNGNTNFSSTWAADDTLLEYPNLQNLFGVGHSGTVWHTNFYYRKYNPLTSYDDAPWDYIRWHWKYSRDLEECAALFVEEAESRPSGGEIDIIDYRLAVIKVSRLTAGATKTALEGRLATLKTTLDGEIDWRIIINNSNSAFSQTGYNTITNHADNSRIDDLVDDNGTTLTGIDYFIGDNPLTSTYQANIASNRGRHHGGGFPIEVNNAGMRIGTASPCPMGFDGLPAGTYTLRIYANEGSGGFTQKELTATIGGVSKTQFIQGNSILPYVEWTGLDETDLASFSVGANTSDIYITAIELVKN
jgi:hypothetical protein